jgi:hypothetical protein
MWSHQCSEQTTPEIVERNNRTHKNRKIISNYFVNKPNNAEVMVLNVINCWERTDFWHQPAGTYEIFVIIRLFEIRKQNCWMDWIMEMMEIIKFFFLSLKFQIWNFLICRRRYTELINWNLNNSNLRSNESNDYMMKPAKWAMRP